MIKSLLRVIRIKFARWEITCDYGTVIRTHSWSNAVDWVACVGPNGIIRDCWNGKCLVAWRY